ncbi:MAG: hypothetical protein AAF399_10990, partial [Bacteroidota bacterium]
PIQRFEWTHARKIQTAFTGMHYSTPDFYPRVPGNWYKWAGAWRGWRWMEECRKIEIAAGDKLFSPFVAPGWSTNPEVNVRPSQYLGLLKCLGVIGAEFYYPGFFNVGRTVAKPQNYIWQAAMPAYAQAITSRYEHILREGDLLLDEEGEPIVRTWAGNPMILATVRKHPDQPIYIISTTLQPLSNGKGVVADQDVAWIDIEGQLIQLMSRRQGSTYYLDLQSSTEPIFFQLDSWHEAGHPAYWSEDFAWEGEVPDYVQGGKVQTEFPADREASDFTSFTSFLQLEGEDACAKYHFQPRETSSYSLSLVGRKQGNGAAKITCLIDGKEIGSPITLSGKWAERSLRQTLSRLSPEPHVLTIKALNGTCEIDHLQLIKQ